MPKPTIYVDLTTIESGYEAFKKLITQAPEITAICAVNDSMAIGAIRAARAYGLNTPENISVIGFDDIDWATLNDPSLTTVSIPKRQLGAEASRRLLALLEDPDLAPTELTISVRLIERASTAHIK